MVGSVIQAERETVNIEDVGLALGISRHTAYVLARRDELPVPVIKIGRRIVVSRRALDDLLNRRKGEEVPNRAA